MPPVPTVRINRPAGPVRKKGKKDKKEKKKEKKERKERAAAAAATAAGAADLPPRGVLLHASAGGRFRDDAVTHWLISDYCTPVALPPLAPRDGNPLTAPAGADGGNGLPAAPPGGGVGRRTNTKDDVDEGCKRSSAL
eukprot:gene33070-52325_t